MKALHTDPYSAHEEISLLLPWYVNKTLQGAELAKVETHLQVCLLCRRELASLHKLAAAVQEEGAFDSAALASFSQLKSRIHQTAAFNPENPAPPVALAAHRKFGKVMPRTVWAMAAMVLLSLLLPGYLGISNIQIKDYRTLSNPEIPSTDAKNTISLIFADGTQTAQINNILALVDGQIIAGPSAQGVYKVAIVGEVDSDGMLARVAALRNDVNVIFAEPAYALLSSANAGMGKK